MTSMSIRKETLRLLTTTEMLFIITGILLFIPHCISYSSFSYFQLLFFVPLSIVCLVIEVIGLLSGFTLSHARLHVLAFVSHFCGTSATIGMILNLWSVSAFPIIFTITILIPVSLDILYCTLRWYVLPVGLR